MEQILTIVTSSPGYSARPLLWRLPKSPRSIMVSAGEASGDYYAAEVVRELNRRMEEPVAGAVE